MAIWEKKIEELVGSQAGGDVEQEKFVRANADLVAKTLEGVSVYSGRRAAESGVHAVVNISAAHIPAVCKAAEQGDDKPYKNFYDLGRQRVGDSVGTSKREQVDRCLPLDPGADYRNIYFCAAELNGTGVRYYGDVCLVLRRTSLESDTIFLDRNSFEFFLPPLAGDAATTMREHSGRWEPDLKLAATVKTLERVRASSRLLTSGQISESLLEDEDYIEVLREGSFGPSDVIESRTSAADASLESIIARRARSGPTPAPEELLWMQRRRDAAIALERSGCRLRIVTTPGRERM